jgi:Putative transposase
MPWKGGGVRQGIPAAFTSPASDLLQCCGLSAGARSIGWSTPKSRSPGPGKSCAICRATPTASRSPIADLCPPTRAASSSGTRTYRFEGPARHKTMTLATDKFIRRFLTQVLPKSFHRIRHYGLLASGNRAANIAHARELLAVPPPAKPETPKAALDQPRVLPRPCPCCGGPHDRHRDFRTRLRAEAPAHAAAGRNQDRHLMMLSPLIDGRPDTRFSCRPTAGSTQARINFLDRSATQPSIGSPYARPTRFHPRKLRSFKLKRARRPQRSNPTKPKPAAKSP